jgi:hypothetical protein
VIKLQDLTYMILYTQLQEDTTYYVLHMLKTNFDHTKRQISQQLAKGQKEEGEIPLNSTTP